MAEQIASAKAEVMLEIAHLAKKLEDATQLEQATAAEAARLNDEVEILRRELKLVEAQLDHEATIAKNYRQAERASVQAATVRATLAIRA